MPPSSLRDKWVPESAQTTEVLLDAIARSDGTRLSVAKEIFATHVSGGIIGSFRFDLRGDVDPATFSLYRFSRGREVLVGRVPYPST